ncbi:2TM domain-containing protein [Aggregatimonas sangjinii]|uniref:2TM domain-containing protein n=1 Tax=Aggregatimonas sangjinii TaxID=2583587 RepID=A0A5B7SSY8_9FLAO|nr:2TM domain-containing protein [Aggregatimonas sangjinii]QCX00439.1 2TM domain-containing protein [Aggregatimonas sangjinii]
MKSKTERLTKYERAKKRVARIRKFYNHATIYVVVTIILFLLRHEFTFILLSKRALGNPEFLEWIDWNVYGTAIVWGVILAIHGITVFSKPLFGKSWEERQLKKFMEEEERRTQ